MSRRPEDPECRAMQQHLEAWLDGELAPADMAALDDHLADCRACRRELQKAERVRRTLAELPERDAPAAVLVAVRERIEAPPWYRRPDLWRGLRGPLPMTLAAIALLLISVAIFTSRTGPSSRAIEERALAQATEEARFALGYLGRVGRETGLLLRDEHLEKRVLAPVAQSLDRAAALAARADDSEHSDSEETSQ